MIAGLEGFVLRAVQKSSGISRMNVCSEGKSVTVAKAVGMNGPLVTHLSNVRLIPPEMGQLPPHRGFVRQGPRIDFNGQFIWYSTHEEEAAIMQTRHWLRRAKAKDTA